MNKQVKDNVIALAISEDLKKFKKENYHICPNCGHVFEWNDANYNPEEHTYTCEKCRETFDETEFEKYTAFDLIENMYLSYFGLKSEDFESESI